MKTKKIFNWMLMAAVVLGLGWTVAACSDDDDENNSGNEELKAQDPYEKNGAEASALFRVVSTLCELDSLPDNWKTTSFEPTKGKTLDASQPLVRTMAVANLAEAVSMFRTLTGENTPDDATTATWSKDGVGSLKFTATNSSSETAVIDVNIKQMPKLAQLRLVPASAMGENGTFTGDPYYHIGDVVKDKDGRHWICVRSAYSPAGKEDTHWVTMQLLTADSRYTKFKSNVRTIKAKAGKNGLHKIQQHLGNGEDTKHLEYFAQLMYILNNPSEYSGNYAKGQVLEDGLGDLGVNAHPRNYVEKLANYWNTKDIWSLVLPGIIENNQLTKGTVTKDYFRSTTGFNMLYYGHDFSMMGIGNDCTIYTCQQSGTCLSSQTLGKKTWAYNDNEKTMFDCTDFALKGEADKQHTTAGFTEKAIVIVQASGKQLNGGTNPGPTKAIAQCTDVVVGKNLGFGNEAPINTNDEPLVGHIITDKGDVFASYNDAARATDKLPIAMIVYIHPNASLNRDLDDATGKRFLAIALRPAADGIKDTHEWGPTNKLCGTAIDQDSEYQKLIATKNGLDFTDLLTATGHGHSHPAAMQCKEYIHDLFLDENYQVGGHRSFAPSNFFLPAVGQWVMAFKGMGVWDISSQGAKVIQTINALYDKANVPQDIRLPLDGSSIWTGVEASEGYAYAVKIDSQNGIRFVKEKKDTKLKVYPFILFG
ncbi:MAG: hypothetical protein IKG77_05395 [Prevotella sp.]|nr:hypothetical protein [Prevotella sp.]